MAKKQAAENEEFYFTRPTTQLDLEARFAAEENDGGDEEDAGREYAVEGNDTSAYIGVDREYMTYAEDTHKPMLAEEGVEQEAERRAMQGVHPQSVLAMNSGSAVKEAAEKQESNTHLREAVLAGEVSAHSAPDVQEAEQQEEQAEATKKAPAKE